MVLKKLVIKKKIEDEDTVIPEERMLDISGHSRFFVGKISSAVVVRVTGSFEGKAFRLVDGLDWEIGIDEEGAKCLVPLKKKEEC